MSKTVSCEPSELAPYEAEILLYLLPQAQTVRKENWDIGWEIQTSPALNQKDFFQYWVYNSRRPSHGSVTIGYFAINKHTAEVWDTTNLEIVESKDLGAVEDIIRKGHCIDSTVIKNFSSRNPGIPSP